MTEYSRDEKPADFLLPESVKNWFTHMYTHMISGNVSEMARLYDREFTSLTNSYFKQTAWPEPSSIEQLVENDPTFLLLYKQLYFRHMFYKLTPSMEDKVESWRNYQELFDGILDEQLELEALPSQWLFDIIGEFVYQYQTFCQFRAKNNHTPEILAQLQVHQDIWKTSSVLNYLNAFVNYSKIVTILKQEATQEEQDTEEEVQEEEEVEEANSDTIKELGYFALLGLSRIHVLIGDYYTSLKLLEPLELNTSKRGYSVSKKQRYSTNQIHEKCASAHISLLYHVGFAQLMLQDFSNAIRSLTSLIMQVHRNRNYYSRFGDFDQLNKFSDKALALIKITIYLCPGYKVNDHIHTSLREKFQDKQQKLSKGDISVLTDLFHFASPKFILLSAPINPTTSVNANQLQLQHFEQLIARQRHVTSLRSFIKLYRSIDLKKLADFLNEDAAAAAKLAVAAKASKSSKDPVEREVQEEQQEPTVEPLTTEQVRALLMAYKLNAAAYKADVHFFLSQSLVKVDEDISNQRTGEFFMNHIHKFARIVDECAVE